MAEIELNLDYELEMLKEELANNESLFKEIKSHYDAISSNRGTGTLSFVQNQTANLISLKSNRLSIIQQIITAKKIEAETKIKVITATKGADNGNESMTQMASAMYDLILSNKKDRKFEEIMNQKSEEVGDQVVEDIDALLDARLAEESIVEEDIIEEVMIDNEPENTFVIDVTGEVYCVDSEFNVLEDVYLHPSIKITLTKDDEGDYTARDQHGKEYSVVEFE